MSRSDSEGFSVVEVLLAGALLSIAVSALIGAIIAGQEAARTTGDRNRASFYAEEGLEAVRNIRDNAFSNLTDGTYGLVQSGGKWTLAGVSDNSGIFTRSVQIGTVDSDTKSVIATVNWQQTLQRPGLISLETRMTNWQASGPVILVH